ncbi:band 4.1-like protein 2 [Callorhinchus milii]|uniref:band 4.1-like protein 2 n=1 Tax=Callorhinchus milii TaxID=7868 RepID=UPI001C3FC135|nr:band 4.1-like protein 2 [Callorhinchus milii]
MATDVGSKPEIKEFKETEQDQPQDSNLKDSVNAKQEQNDTKEDQQSVSTEQLVSEHEPSSPSTSTASPSSSERKEQSGGKGLSRFLPGWLKKQKSLTLVQPIEDKVAENTNDTPPEESETPPEECEPLPEESEPLPEESEPVEKEQLELVKIPCESEMVKEAVPTAEVIKVDDREEECPLSSAEIQPAKEEKNAAGTLEKDTDLKSEEITIEEKGSGEPKKDDDSNKKSPLKIPKMMKAVQCKVLMLDGSEYTFEIEKTFKGQLLMDKVCEQINLLERDYFGLTFRDAADQKNWLDPAKEIKKQIRSWPWQFAFNVKFYPPDPIQLTEDITRYYLCLQLRQDIISGRLPCSFVTHALLGSFTLQAELGDYDEDEHRADYVSEFQFAPNHTKELEEKVVELHKTHRGLTPAQADTQFLENAKKLSMYGVDLHHAKDSEGVDIMLGVCANGLLIYKDRLRINRFAWPKILKISYKRSNFYIKIRPGEMEQFESTIGFKLPNHRAAKKLWKVCVEHHTFFRLVSPEQPPKTKFLTLGSKFRYSGRTQAQTRQASNLIDRPAPYFERTSSKRTSRSLDGAPVDTMNDVQDSSTPAVSQSSTAEVTVTTTDEKTAAKDKTTPFKTAQLDMPVEKTEEEEVQQQKNKSLGIDGGNIYIRHSNLMLEDLDKTQEDVLKHQASISELKRSFMESTPEPRPNEWEKRFNSPLLLQTEGSLEEEITSLLFSKDCFSTGLVASFPSAISPASEGAVLKEKTAAESITLSHSKQLSEDLTSRAQGLPAGPRDVAESSDEKQKPEMKEQAEVVVEETIVIEERKRTSNRSKVKKETTVESNTVMPPSKVTAKEGSVSSSDSNSESEDEAEYNPQTKEGENENQEEQNKFEMLNRVAVEFKMVMKATKEPRVDEISDQLENVQEEMQKGEIQEEIQTEEQEDTKPKINGDVSHVDSDSDPQVVCYSEPPVVKTEMVTISDTVSSDKMEIATKEVPIVQTETKTITYEAAQGDGSGDNDPGVLMSAQTITSESVCTTMTTHITKTVKGGVSETRIEKRIVITGDTDIDHDQALAQAIKEAKEQHPDMSVTRVVVHKETELTEDGEE